MPDTGAPWNIPYVVSSDLVKDYPTDSLALANAIAAGLDAAGLYAQIVQTVKTDTFSTTSTSMTDVTGLSAAITPSSATNKVLVTVDLSWAYDVSTGGGYHGMFDVLRDSTSLIVPTSPGSRTPAAQSYNLSGLDRGAFIMSRSSFVYLDSPATTSSTTYKVQAMVTTGGTFYVNRSVSDTDVASIARSVSSITVAEVNA